MSNSQKYLQKYLQIKDEASTIFSQKNQDYGDSFTHDGIIGVLVRLGDKIQRMKHVTKNGINLVKNETLRDTILDLHNYSVMAIMLLDENEETNTKIINQIKNANCC